MMRDIVAAVEEISIHVPREGHDENSVICSCASADFNPRAPRGARPTKAARIDTAANFNPRAPRGARRRVKLDGKIARVISIHVPREGHDESVITKPAIDFVFQSTCPARGTTFVNPLIT